MLSGPRTLHIGDAEVGGEGCRLLLPLARHALGRVWDCHQSLRIDGVIAVDTQTNRYIDDGVGILARQDEVSGYHIRLVQASSRDRPLEPQVGSLVVSLGWLGVAARGDEVPLFWGRWCAAARVQIAVELIVGDQQPLVIVANG